MKFGEISLRSRHGVVGNECKYWKYLPKVAMEIGKRCIPYSNSTSNPTVYSYHEVYSIKLSCNSF